MTDTTTPPPLDPALAEVDRRWKASGVPGLYEGSGPEMRERARNIRAFLYPKPLLPTGRIENFTIPSATGTTAPTGPAIPMRAIWPLDTPEPTATLVYYHGGGWIVGDIDSHEAHCIRIANRTGAVVVSVGYRLAPEDPFPAGVHDALDAVRWVHAHRARFAGADRPLAVGGDSAGGNLAAVAAVVCRDEGIALAAQLLLYPATDLTGPGHGAVGEMYLGTGPDAEAKARDPLVSPRWAPTLAGVAPVLLGVGPHDFLYRDNLAYAAALQAAGVPTALREFPTLNHGFFSYTAISEDSRVAADALCDELRAMLVAAAH
ncbi:MAG: Carboxylesterase NlhH [Pseudomonadota bacterium]|jgi:acetyl esterase/lipase